MSRLSPTLHAFVKHSASRVLPPLWAGIGQREAERAPDTRLRLRKNSWLRVRLAPRESILSTLSPLQSQLNSVQTDCAEKVLVESHDS